MLIANTYKKYSEFNFFERLIDFHGMSTCMGLLCLNIRKPVHCAFLFIFLVLLFVKSFIFFICFFVCLFFFLLFCFVFCCLFVFLLTNLSNTNNFLADLLDDTLVGPTTASKSGPVINVNEGVIHTSKISWTGASSINVPRKPLLLGAGWRVLAFCKRSNQCILTSPTGLMGHKNRTHDKVLFQISRKCDWNI